MNDDFGSVLEQVRKLNPIEKIRLVESILPEIETELSSKRTAVRRQWKGIYRDSGPVPTEEDMREMREEAWPGQ